jgi:hypothetical protein
MQQDLITQIVPRLPTAVCGVGDYAVNLATRLRQDFGLQTRFIVGDLTWAGSSEIEGFPVYRLPERSAQALVAALADTTESSILLHYVGYGYARRGCPSWLVDGLTQWRSSTNHTRLVTMFHELYATSVKPWTSVFWLSGWQKKLVRQLSCLSDHSITSRQGYATTLRQLCRDTKLPITILPIFSTIGEPAQLIPLSKRHKRMVIFGHKNSRTLVYRHHVKQLAETCEAIQIQEIYDIGTPTGLSLTNLFQVPIYEIGVESADKVRNVLLESITGFLAVPSPEYYAKSSVFAAYCAHAVLTLTASESTSSKDDGLVSQVHYWPVGNSKPSISLEAGEQIARNAHSWYMQHSLAKQARIFRDILQKRNNYASTSAVVHTSKGKDYF